jgi:hypothetical protein
LTSVPHDEKNQLDDLAIVSVFCELRGFAKAAILEKMPAMRTTPPVLVKPRRATPLSHSRAYNSDVEPNEANSAFLRTKLLNVDCTLGNIHPSLMSQPLK